MSELETMAARAFEKFAAAIGQTANWAYLSEERKQSWMCEIIFYVDHVNSKLKEKIKPMGTQPPGGAYAAGYNDGIAVERMAIMNLIETLGDDYKNQFNERLENIKEKERQAQLG